MKILLLVLAALALTECKVTPRHDLTKDWWESSIFYQIYPRSFKDSDGDGIGDLKGITSKLEHLKELGIGATWLSPIFTSPMADFGYDIADFYNVDPIFGTMEDLQELFDEAKKLDIKIILDFVPNHSSNECDWFLKSIDKDPVYDNYYVWHSGKVDANGNFILDNDGNRVPPNNWQSVFYGSAWTWNAKRQQFYFHQFTKEQPDLNYRNEAVVEEMKKVLRFWLNKGVSGFRIDAVNHLFEIETLEDEPLTHETDDPFSFGYTHHIYTQNLDEMYDMIFQWREVLDEYKEGDTRIMLTEAYANETYTMKYYQSEDKSRQGSHMPFNFVLIEDLSEHSSAADFERVINSRLNALPEGKVTNWVMGNHDKPRVGSRYGSQKIDVLLTLVMTLPGVAVTYNGEEIGMVDNRDGITWEQTVDPQGVNAGEADFKWASRDPERTPFQWDDSKYAGFSEGSTEPWLPIHENYKWLNLKNQKEHRRSTFKYYKELSELRKEHTFIDGDFKTKVVSDTVLTYVRSLEEHETYVVLLNFGETEEVVDVTQLTDHFGPNAKVVVAGADSCYSEGDIVPTNDVYLRKYNAIILANGSSRLTVSLVLMMAAVIIKFLF